MDLQDWIPAEELSDDPFELIEQLATPLDTPGAVYGDSAFAGSRPEQIILAHGGAPRVVHAGTWGGAEALARLQAHSAEVRRVRTRSQALNCPRNRGNFNFREQI